MTRVEEIAAGLRAVRDRIALAAARSGRPGGTIRLVAVSKKMPLADVRAAMAAGQRDFGENYAQELRDKRDAWTAAADGGEMPRWHYIGPLQKNKVKLLAGRVELIHAVEDEDVLIEIDRRAAAAGATQGCLVQVNVAGEAQKHGIAPERLPALLDRFAAATHATCAGLMLIPPMGTGGGGGGDDTRRHFAALRALAETEARVARPRVSLTELSMGMSGDFTAAIEEGATIVRVGTAIFGARVAAR